MAGDVESYLAAAPLRQSDGGEAQHGKRRWLVLLIVLVGHLAALHWAMRHAMQARDRGQDRPVDVTLIEPEASRPIPELRKAPPSQRRSPIVLPEQPAIATKSAPPATDPSPPHVTLFNPDGSLRLPSEAKPQRGLPEPDIIKGRELMGRGLDCEAPDAPGSGESLGEGVARKYLSWIGLYNPYSAQHRAELREERKERCKRWRGQS